MYTKVKETNQTRKQQSKEVLLLLMAQHKKRAQG
jgi:hypothetical protein